MTDPNEQRDLNLVIHRALIPRVMSLLPAIGTKQGDYDQFLAEISRAILDAGYSKDDGRKTL